MYKLDTMDEYKELFTYLGATIGAGILLFCRRFLLKALGGHPDWQELKHMIGQSNDQISCLRREFSKHAIVAARIEERQRALSARVDKLE